MKLKKIYQLALAATMLFSISCNNDDNNPVDPTDPVQQSVIAANEGNFGTPTASVSLITPNLTVTNGVYAANNSGNLGDVLQDVGVAGSNIFFVLNNSNKVVVADRATFKKKGEITEGIKQPRYIAFTSDYAYVTNSSNKDVTVYKQSDFSYVKSIPVNATVERIVEAGGNLFVQNAAFGSGTTITIIDGKKMTVTGTYTVPAGNITKTVSSNGSVYVLSSTAADSYLYQLSSAGSLLKTYDLKGMPTATNLDIDGNSIYFTAGTGVYSMKTDAAAAPAKPLFNVKDNAWSTFYGFNVIDGKIYTADAKGFTEDSEVTVYDTAGTVLKVFKTGIGTNGFYKL